jgi:hypothetical protein
MKLIYNKNFEKSARVDELSSSIEELDGGLLFFKNPKIVVRDDCHYFESTAPSIGFTETLVDRTGNECFYNKIFLDDIWLGRYSNSEKKRLSVYASRLLAAKLEAIYSDKFNVILSFEAEENEGLDAVVRFHKIRKNETWLVPDLEQYKTNSILIIQT